MSDEREVRFSELHLEGGEPVETNVRHISYADIKRCPHTILLPEHYREDGTCRCDDPDYPEMIEAGYEWRDGRWQ